MTIMELGALGEFLGVFALVATLIYLSIQVRYTRDESEKAVLEARTTGIRELALSAATSEGLSAALVKADEAVGDTPHPFESGLISRGLDALEAHRVWRFYVASWRLDMTQYETVTPEQRNTQDMRLRAVYLRGVGRLFWDNFGRSAQGSARFTEHVDQLIAEADQQPASRQ